MLDQGNRTFIGSVVFVDIVGYSKKSVSEQITLKDRFTSILADCLKDIALEQRIILDTGDGAAMSFLGDPEDALFVSMHMREFLQRAYADLNLPENAAQEDIDIGPQGDLSVRIGINLGPVKLLRDINGHPNIVGDGINVAQRIMSFARPGQIVVSRSYFDVVSVISDEYAKIFKYEGSRTDKHVREHEIYVVGESVAAFNQARASLADRAASTNPNTWAPHNSDIGSGTYAILNEANGNTTLSFWQDREKLTLVGSILGALVLALIVAAWMKKTAAPATNAPAIAAPAAQLLPPIAPPLAAAVATPDAAKFGDTASVPLSQGATAPTVPAAPMNRATDANSAKPTNVSGSASETAKTAALKRASEGTLRLNIDPWGNVFVNGRVVGVSPPLKRYDLPAGKYKIEVRNGTFTSYVTEVEVKAKEDVIVKHRFQ
jgi:class 3 adenylate cyclase